MNHSEHDSADQVPTPSSPPPPQGARLWVMVTGAVIACVALIVGLLAGPWAHGLVGELRANQEQRAADGTWYISQMHPWIIQPEPGQCPICGMDLTPVDPKRFAGEIAIDPVIVQNMGVRTALADRGPIVRQIRTAGTVEWDQSLITNVNLRFGGWIETVQVDSLWERVAQGDPLFTIYAPTIANAASEYASALRQSSERDPDTLVRTAERRLRLAGVPEDEIQRLKMGGEPREVITITAPANGVVIAKEVNAGSQVMPQTIAYRIADPRRVWIEAIIYEQDLDFVQEGQQVEITGTGRVPVSGTIDMIYPVIDPRTREVRIRMIFENSDLHLRPGRYVTVTIEKRLLGEHVRIPQMAVIGTGERNIVFVSMGRGKFEPRNVTVGPANGDGLISITSGIEAGEHVVISGQFLLDSESKMREALVKVMQGDLASEQIPVVAPPATGQIIALPTSVQGPWKDLLLAYLALQDGLYTEAPVEVLLASVQSRATAFLAAGQAADEQFNQRQPLVAKLVDQINAMQPGTGLKAAFGAVSSTLNDLLAIFGQPAGLGSALVGMRCGMAKGIPEKGLWIQAGNDIRNPYFGAASEMRSCAAAGSWGIASPSKPPASPPPVPKPTPEQNPVSGHGEDGQATADPVTVVTKDQMNAYLVLADAAYMGDLQRVQQAAHGLHAHADSRITANLTGIFNAQDLTQARQALGAISVLMRDRLRSGFDTGGELVRVFRCGMYRDAPERGIWIQRGEGEPHNPFFGRDAGMSACAKQTWTVGPEGLNEVAP